MIPPFHGAVDRCLSYLDPVNGLLGVADFYVSSKHDLPLRQMSWARRFFWHATFDTDGISIGPERRAYLDTKLSRVWEMNSQVSWILDGGLQLSEYAHAYCTGTASSVSSGTPRSTQTASRSAPSVGPTSTPSSRVCGR